MSVLNLGNAINAVLVARGSRNIQTILRPVSGATWKTSPSKALVGLVSISDLILELLALCPNTQVPRKKLVDSLLKLHEEEPILFSARDPINFCAEMGALIRKAMSKLRVAATTPLLYERAVSQVRI